MLSTMPQHATSPRDTSCTKLDANFISDPCCESLLEFSTLRFSHKGGDVVLDWEGNKRRPEGHKGAPGVRYRWVGGGVDSGHSVEDEVESAKSQGEDEHK